MPNDVCKIRCALQHVASAAVCAGALCVTRLQCTDDKARNTGIVSTLPGSQMPGKNGTKWKSHARRAVFYSMSRC